MAGKLEKTFQAEFNRSIRSLIPDAHFAQIPNAPYSPNIIRKPIQKPYDCYCLSHGIFCAMELKVVKGAVTFGLDKIKPHQIENLLRVEKNGGQGYLLFNVSAALTIADCKKYNLDKKRLNYIYSIRISEFVDFCQGLDRKSIPFTFFVEKYKEGRGIVPRIKLPDGTAGWDVRELWTYFGLDIQNV